MNTTWKITIVTILFWGFSAWNPLRSTAATPTEQLQGTLEEIVAILKNSPSNSEADATAFRTNLIQAISPRFDFTEMAKRCLGSHWGNRTAEEQREFVKILAGFLGRSYVGNIQSYTNQRVVYTREFKDTNYAEVDTKIITEQAKDVFVNYKLHLVNNDWKVYDVVIDNVSVINNYRSQFNRVIARSSFENLVRMMKDKQPQGLETTP